MIEDYFARAAACRTENQRNAIHIALENYLCPREIAALHADPRLDAAGPASRAWIEHLRSYWPEPAAPPQPWTREEVSAAISLYTDGATGRGDKPLLIGFAGLGHRIMMPVPVMLQHLDARSCDVLLLRDPSTRTYVFGIEGVAGDFESLLAWIRSWVQSRSYRRCITLGASYGGLPAHAAAAALGFTRGVSVGGVAPGTTWPRSSRLGVSYAVFSTCLARHRPRETELVYAYASGHTLDRSTALSLGETRRTRLLAIPGCAEHNVLFELAKARLLAPFLDSALADPADTARRFRAFDLRPPQAADPSRREPLMPLRRALRAVRGALERRREAALIARSTLFDGDWYRREYPDVARAGLDPVAHYLGDGAAQGRDPGPSFSTGCYLAARPDVIEARMNPLVHYLRFGHNEGYEASPARVPD